MAIKAIEPLVWSDFLTGFSIRNHGRRARFEIFGPRASVDEEIQEAEFESVSLDDRTAIVKRIDQTQSQPRVMIDKFPNIRGIAVQYDNDGSEVMLELTNDKGVMTALHFESLVDGDS